MKPNIVKTVFGPNSLIKPIPKPKIVKIARETQNRMISNNLMRCNIDILILYEAYKDQCTGNGQVSHGIAENLKQYMCQQ